MKVPAYAVILAGGKGERFWPLSRADRPKQLLALVGAKPMVTMAVERLRGVVPAERILVITTAGILAAVRRTLPMLPAEQVIGEPFGRDTAAALALATGLVKARDPQGVYCVLTADHVITQRTAFRQVLRDALAFAARQDVLITIGVQPTAPSTGFGYIEAGQAVGGVGRTRFCVGKRFLEKPDAATARRFLRTGRHYWNSGMFIWSVASIERAFVACQPRLAALIDRVAKVGTDRRRLAALLRTEYRRLPKISIDYAVMEKARNVVMARAAFGWDDVGSWPALENHFPKDAARNVLVGKCAVLDASGNIVVSRERLTALLGVRDLVVIQAEGVTLVCARNRAQDVKQLVRHLAARRRYRHLL